MPGSKRKITVKDESERPNKLPMSMVANHFVEQYVRHPAIVLMGETGSGKSTQIPQILFEYFKSVQTRKFKIVITQPRRIAAITLAARVQQELNESCLSKKYGIETDGIVGYAVRFDSTVTNRTKIIFMTEGILIKESMTNPNFSQYKVIIIDEAHERSVDTDICMGLVKTAQQVRNHSESSFSPLKVIVMTATGEADKFFRYFEKSKVLLVSGRMYPVEVKHLHSDPEEYLSATISKVIDLHGSLPSSDHILVFLTGQEEIEGAVRYLRALSNCCPLAVFPLYASLPKSQQQQAFDMPPSGTRKIVVATNIAETSVTIPGIKIVVDCGHVKSRYYMDTCSLDALQVHRISQSQSQQRAGRAGRECNGTVYRMFTKNVFLKMEPFDMPEIQRSDLCSLFLLLGVLGYRSVDDFPFLDPPEEVAVENARKELQRMDLISKSKTELKLTVLGVALANIPLEPKLAYIYWRSCDWGVYPEITTVIAMIEADTIYESNHGERDQTMASYWAPEGDFATYLNIYRAYKKSKAQSVWCQTNRINQRSMKYAVKVRGQLMEWAGGNNITAPSSDEEIKQAVTTVFANCLGQNRAELEPAGRHYIIRNSDSKKPSVRAKIHPSSALARSTPPRIIFTRVTLNESNEVFMHHCAVLDNQVDKRLTAGPKPKVKETRPYVNAHLPNAIVSEFNLKTKKMIVD